jgi:hypothetical protein
LFVGILLEAKMEHPTTLWQPMQDGNVFYRRQQCYSIPGKLPDLNDYTIAGCKYGGPVGTPRVQILLNNFLMFKLQPL